MKSASAETYKKYKESAERGTSREHVIVALKDEDYPILEAIKVIRKTYDISLGDAKIAVSSHAAWKNTVDGAQGLHDDFKQAFKS